MSDLTREEITRVYKAVDSALPTNSIALALLEAWRLATDENPYRRVLVTLEDPPTVVLQELTGPEDDPDWNEWWAMESDLPTAAIRAVNAWAESRKEPEQ